ncbi:MAG: hypothetical protein ACOY90_11980 [Candidatus Zhuqueibacterota bacterium]
MDLKTKLLNIFDLLSKLIRYNLKIIFANKFIYMLLSALAIFILVTVIMLFDENSNPDVGSVYYLLLVPGLLLIFYPTTFGIQNDVDARMLEILFGIPNYRYKIWLVRVIIIYIGVFFILLLLGILSSIALTSIPIFSMVVQLMFPIFFLGSLAFLFSTLIRNGYGTAVVIIIIGLVFWIAGGILSNTKWNIFLNPFDIPSDVNEVIWQNITTNNRIILLVGTVVAILWGLLNLQKREKFV